MTEKTASSVKATKGVYAKLLEARNRFEIEKVGVLPDNKGGGLYWRAEDMVAKAREIFTDLKLLTTNRNVHLTHNVNFPGGEINSRYRPSLSLVGEFVVIDIEDGSEFAIEIIAEGSDTGGDSSSPKAMTQFRKTALLQLLYAQEPGTDADMNPSRNDDAEAEAAGVQPSLAPSQDVEKMRSKIRDFISGDKERHEKVSEAGSKASGGREFVEWSSDPDVLAKVIEELSL